MSKDAGQNLCQMVVAFMAIVMGGGVNLCCAGIWPTYNSASGTLPQEQGWIFYDANEPTSPAVVDGLLHQGLTSATGVQGWTDDSRIICFGSTDRFNIYFTLKVIQSDYTVVNNQWDSGFKVWAYDNAGRFACVGISSDGVRLTISSDFSTSSSKSTAFYPMDTTDGFHSYSLSVVHINVWNEDRVNLSIDGNAYTVNAFHYLGQAAQGDYNIVGFGDESISGGSQIELERFGFYVQNSYGLLDEGWLTDIHDLQIFAGQWLRTDCDCDGFCEQADINQDGRVDIKDLSIICDVWLEERSS